VGIGVFFKKLLESFDNLSFYGEEKVNKQLRGDFGNAANTIPKSVPKKPIAKQPTLKPVTIKKSGRGK